MNWEKILLRSKLFILNLPKTLQETSIWIIASYLIPILNIGIIWGIQGDDFKITTNILSIVIITNACFFTSLYYLAFTNKKERRTLSIISIVAYVTTVVFFTVSIIEVEISKSLFTLKLYKLGALISFLVALFLALVNKYDEVQAISKARAAGSKGTTETSVDGKNVKV